MDPEIIIMINIRENRATIANNINKIFVSKQNINSLKKNRRKRQRKICNQ